MRNLFLSYLLCLAFLGTSARSFACGESYAQIFKATFSSKAYVGGECQANACRLLKALKESGQSLEDTKVVYFMGVIAPRHQRNPFAEWPYHTMVKHKNQALDLDFKREPTLLSFDEYMKQNWLPEGYPAKPLSQVGGSQVQVVEVSAKEYLEHFPLGDETVPAMEKFIRDVVSNKPVQTLKEFAEGLR